MILRLSVMSLVAWSVDLWKPLISALDYYIITGSVLFVALGIIAVWKAGSFLRLCWGLAPGLCARLASAPPLS